MGFALVSQRLLLTFQVCRQCPRSASFAGLALPLQVLSRGAEARPLTASRDFRSFLGSDGFGKHLARDSKRPPPEAWLATRAVEAPRIYCCPSYRLYRFQPDHPGK